MRQRFAGPFFCVYCTSLLAVFVVLCHIGVLVLGMWRTLIGCSFPSIMWMMWAVQVWQFGGMGWCPHCFHDSTALVASLGVRWLPGVIWLSCGAISRSGVATFFVESCIDVPFF